MTPNVRYLTLCNNGNSALSPVECRICSTLHRARTHDPGVRPQRVPIDTSHPSSKNFPAFPRSWLLLTTSRHHNTRMDQDTPLSAKPEPTRDRLCAMREAARVARQGRLSEQRASRTELEPGFWLYRDTPPGVGWVIERTSTGRKVYFASRETAMSRWASYWVGHL
jgi:hypothetical protein